MYVIGFILAALFWWAVWGRADKAQASLDQIAAATAITAMTDEMKAEHWAEQQRQWRSQQTEEQAIVNAAKQAKADRRIWR